jgi:hypothetical protein
MEKSEHLSDKVRLAILHEELAKFRKIIKGHEKMLEAIGKL